MGPVALLLGCTMHWGMPPATVWHLATVSAPVAEPEVDRSVQDALLNRLSLRRALGNSEARSLTAEVLAADWLPVGRSGDQLLYEARLLVRLRAGPQERTFSASQTVPDPGSAAAAVPLRNQVFAQLAEVVATAGVNWVLSLPAG